MVALFGEEWRTHSESSRGMSACEYEAPTTRPDSRPELFGGSRSRPRWLGGLQKGDVELRGVSRGTDTGAGSWGILGTV